MTVLCTHHIPSSPATQLRRTSVSNGSFSLAAAPGGSHLP